MTQSTPTLRLTMDRYLQDYQLIKYLIYHLLADKRKFFLEIKTVLVVISHIWISRQS